MPSTERTRPEYSPPSAGWLKTLQYGRDLGRDELRRLALTLAAEPSIWLPRVHHDPEQRQFVQLHRDPHLDVWLLTWTNQQDTGLHDHDISAGAVHVCAGDLVEDRLCAGANGFEQRSVTRPQGSTFDFDASHVHCLRHPGGAAPPAVSIHVYSPALWRMGYYDIGEDGLLRRRSVSYAEEAAA